MQTTELKGRHWVPARRVKARYGNISDMTLWRWLNDPDLGFPHPRYINRQRYWDESQLDEFDRAKATKAA